MLGGEREGFVAAYGVGGGQEWAGLREEAEAGGRRERVDASASAHEHLGSVKIAEGERSHQRRRPAIRPDAIDGRAEVEQSLGEGNLNTGLGGVGARDQHV